MQTKIEVKMEEQLAILPKRTKGNYLKKHPEKKILTNYYPVSMQPLTNIYIYKVVFTPAIMSDNRVLRRKLLAQAFPSIKAQIPYPVLGGMNIYSSTQPNEKEGTHEASGYKIFVKLVKVFDVKNNPKILLLFMNNGIRNIMSSLDYIEIGQTGKYFNVKQKVKLRENNLSLFKGYRANFLFGENGLYLRIDPVNKIVQNKTVLEAINEIYRQEGKERDEKRQIVKQYLINKIIMTNYGRTRYVRIEDVQFKSPLEVLVDGKENISIHQYFETKYGLKSQFTKQPLLKISNKNKNDARVVYMLPEYCLMTGLPDDPSEPLRKEVSSYTIVHPSIKQETISKLAKQINANDERKALMDLGINIQPEPKVVMGKCLPNPDIRLGGSTFVEKGKQAQFKIFPNQVYQAPKELEIFVLYFQGGDVQTLCDILNHTGETLNLKPKIKKYGVQVNNSQNTYSQKNSMLNAIKQAEGKANCYLILLRHNMKSSYNEIKEFCLQRNMLTQIALESNLRKPSTKSIVTNILVQMGAKLGGIPWRTYHPKTIESHAMLLSFDTSKAGGKRKVAGVGTMNSSFTIFASESEDCEDIANKFQKMAKITLSLVNRYLKRNKALPQDLIILTDSCPKNQVKMFYDYYIPQVEEKLDQLNAKLIKKQSRQTLTPVRLTIIQIKDLTNERFFEKQNNSLKNPSPGLLISSEIVSENFDFYLVPQSTRVGCAIPIHFNVIYTKSKLEEGEIEELMYTQCFCYYNWTGSIKIPSLLQYAKKCAKFCSENMKQFNVTDEVLTNRLYFI